MNTFHKWLRCYKLIILQYSENGHSFINFDSETNINASYEFLSATRMVVAKYYFGVKKTEISVYYRSVCYTVREVRMFVASVFFFSENSGGVFVQFNMLLFFKWNYIWKNTYICCFFFFFSFLSICIFHWITSLF